MSDVIVVRTGTANVASVLAGLGRAGAPARLSDQPDDVRAAERLIVPGVGAFGAAMETLRSRGLVEPLRERILAGRPTFMVCLGAQLLCEESDESPGEAGLAVFPLRARRIPVDVRVPHLGWSAVRPTDGARYLDHGHAYFAHSFYLPEVPDGWAGAHATHGPTFAAALERGRVLACQFHPELSGPYGADLLARWLEDRPVEVRSAPVTGSALPRIIPCLDVRDGRVVKGVKFQGLRDAGDPAELAAAYEAQGADEVVLLDVSATPEGRGTRTETVRAVRARLSIPLTVGGGVRAIDDAAALLDAGADKVGVNTAAVARPELLEEMARRFGCQCVVIAIDARRSGDGYRVVVRSGTDEQRIDAVDWAREATRRGAGEVLLTSWDRDGTKEGYDTELTGAVARAVAVPVIASGGAATSDHLVAAIRAGADAVLAASIFHFGETTVGEIKRSLVDAGVEVRR